MGVLALSLLSQGAVAQSYDYVGTTADLKQGGFIDRNSIRREGGSVTAWTLWVYITPLPLDDGTAISHALRRNRYDCRNEMATQLYVSLFLDDGTTGLSETISPQRTEPWVPSTLGWTIGSLLCDPASEVATAYTLEEAAAAIRSVDWEAAE